MLCRLHTVYKIIHCAALHTLCDITQRVSNYYTVKWHIFAFNLEKITPGRNFLHRHRLWCLWLISGMCNIFVREGVNNKESFLLFPFSKKVDTVSSPGQIMLDYTLSSLMFCFVKLGQVMQERKWIPRYLIFSSLIQFPNVWDPAHCVAEEENWTADRKFNFLYLYVFVNLYFHKIQRR